MVTVKPTLCQACQRVLDWPQASICTSFPDGIPVGISFYGDDHRTPLANEAPFELAPTQQAAYDRWLVYHELTLPDDA